MVSLRARDVETLGKISHLYFLCENRRRAGSTGWQSRRDNPKESRMASLQQRRSFEIRAEWDGEAGVWWCSNDELPLTTEAPTFEQLVARVPEIAPEIVAKN